MRTNKTRNRENTSFRAVHSTDSLLSPHQSIDENHVFHPLICSTSHPPIDEMMVRPRRRRGYSTDVVSCHHEDLSYRLRRTRTRDYSHPDPNQSPAEFLRHRQRRRAQSELSTSKSSFLLDDSSESEVESECEVIHSSCDDSSSSYYDDASTEKLQNLQILYQEGFITVTEYKNRRLQLVDEQTMMEQTIYRTTDLIQRQLPVLPRDPPDFVLLPTRDAIKHVFDSVQCKWTSSRIQVKIDPYPFARGGLRQVFHLQDLSMDTVTSFVAKIAIDPNENPDTYFRDVEMQAVASKFAQLYNSYHPPRRVDFLTAWILQLIPSTIEDEDNLTMCGTICGVEPYIAGEYLKHNNNYGYVSELERNTPQTFSHFTYEVSRQQMLIVDIQGVGDHYTDPQIHTRSGKEFGKGNLSIRGFERFLASHRCNPICRYLKLPLTNGQDEERTIDPRGTIPAQPFMNQTRIQHVDSQLCHYYGHSQAFQKYQAKHAVIMEKEEETICTCGCIVS